MSERVRERVRERERERERDGARERQQGDRETQGSLYCNYFNIIPNFHFFLNILEIVFWKTLGSSGLTRKRFSGTNSRRGTKWDMLITCLALRVWSLGFISGAVQSGTHLLITCLRS